MLPDDFSKWTSTEDLLIKVGKTIDEDLTTSFRYFHPLGQRKKDIQQFYYKLTKCYLLDKDLFRYLGKVL